MSPIELLIVFVPIIGLMGFFAVKLAQIIVAKDVPRVSKPDPRIEVLEREVNELRGELAEIKDTVTFTQQLLNKRSEQEKLPPAR